MDGALEASLALLLAAHTPGESPYSKVQLRVCDAKCQESPRCAEPKLACRPPHFSRRHDAFFRYETWEEGVRRYALIAAAIAQAKRDLVWAPVDGCAPPETVQPDDGERCEAQRRARPWHGSERLLELMVTTVASHESSLRRDIHEGTTRGDCDHTERNGRRVVIEGSCRSSCLGQINLPHPDDVTRRGHGRDDLVGLGAEATYRCVEAMVDRLSHARNVCIRRASGDARGHYPACTFGTYGGLAAWAQDPRIGARVKTFRTLRSTPREVPHDVEATLQARATFPR